MHGINCEQKFTKKTTANFQKVLHVFLPFPPSLGIASHILAHALNLMNHRKLYINNTKKEDNKKMAQR